MADIDSNRLKSGEWSSSPTARSSTPLFSILVMSLHLVPELSCCLSACALLLERSTELDMPIKKEIKTSTLGIEKAIS